MIDTIKLRALHTACMTVTEIAEKLESTPCAVEEALKSMGYTPIYTKLGVEPNEFVKERSEMPKGQKISPEKVEEIKALRSDGKTYPEIAVAANVSRTTVARVCQKEKEPAPAAAGTSSNKHNISITDNPGNVNTAEKIPEIVLEALTDTLEDLYSHRREMIEVIENLKNRIAIERGLLNEVVTNITALKKYIRSIGYGDVLTAIDSEQERGKEADA